MTGLNRAASHFEPVFTLTAGPTGATPDTRQSLKRRAVPDDIAPAVAFLSAEEAGWVTGSTVNVDGGHVRH